MSFYQYEEIDFKNANSIIFLIKRTIDDRIKISKDNCLKSYQLIGGWLLEDFSFDKYALHK